jgi:ABC-type multidrug transport system ATPase subunit
LLTKPQILFCDEPTSGLDSFSAYAVMNTLRELAGYVHEPKLFQKPPAASRIILFSIHQPTSDIFHLFTNIILMNAGRIIFHGTVQEAQKLFTGIGLACPQHYNPAEFYVNKISDPNVASDIVKHVTNNKKLDDAENSTFIASESSDDDIESRTKVSWLRQVVLLSHRSTLNFLHDPRSYLIELLILIVSRTSGELLFNF